MSLILRVALVVASVCVFFFVMKKIRMAQLNIDESIYWIFFATLILLFFLWLGSGFFFLLAFIFCL